MSPERLYPGESWERAETRQRLREAEAQREAERAEAERVAARRQRAADRRAAAPQAAPPAPETPKPEPRKQAPRRSWRTLEYPNQYSLRSTP
jgi:hypothetical protein